MEYMLAPMEKITDASFRSICHKYGADLTFTEQIRFETLAKRTKSALERIKIPDNTPTMIQIMGKDEEKLKKFLNSFAPEVGFRGFNFNLGCPSQSYVRQGIGSAMVKRPTKVMKIVDLIKRFDFNVNIKLRLGVNWREKKEKVYIKLIEKVDADFFVVHARYRSESYDVKADWSVFPECVTTGKKIIANGDIRTKKDVEEMEKIGCWGVMIGRAAKDNPLIFGQLKNIEVPTLESANKEIEKLRKYLK